MTPLDGLGTDGWSIYGGNTGPCSSFASTVWTVATGEGVNSYNAWGFSTPSALADSIQELNGGEMHTYGEENGEGETLGLMYLTGPTQAPMNYGPSAIGMAHYASTALAFLVNCHSPSPGARAGEMYAGYEGDGGILMHYSKFLAPLYASMMRGGPGGSMDPNGHEVLRRAGGMSLRQLTGTGAR